MTAGIIVFSSLPERADVLAKKLFHGLDSTSQGHLHVSQIRFCYWESPPMPLWDLLSGSFYDTPDFHRQERPSTSAIGNWWR
jgi:hypothetical protein